MDHYIQTDKGEQFYIEILEQGAITLDALLEKLGIYSYRFISKQQFFVPDFQVTRIYDDNIETKIAEVTHQKHYECIKMK